MWGPIIGAGISAGGSLLGGLLGNSAAAAANAQNMQFGREQLQFQRDLAQQGIRWKVADAQAAGIHPLFAIGAPPFSAAPISVGGGGDSYEFLGRMGQDVSRAVQAALTPEERVNENVAKMEQLKLDNAALQNQLLASQIAKLNAQMGPPLPTAPVGSSPVAIAGAGNFEAKPPEVLNPHPSSVGAQAGPPQPSIEWTRTPTGYASQPPKSGKQEDEFGAPLMAEWLYRNRLQPMLGAQSMAPPMERVRRDYPGATGVYWDYMAMEWRPTFHPSGKGAVGRYIDWRRRNFGG